MICVVNIVLIFGDSSCLESDNYHVVQILGCFTSATVALWGVSSRGSKSKWSISFFFFFQAEDGIRDTSVTGVQTCALPIWRDDPVARPEVDQRRVAGALVHHLPEASLGPAPAQVAVVVEAGHADRVLRRAAGAIDR